MATVKQLPPEAHRILYAKYDFARNAVPGSGSGTPRRDPLVRHVH